MKPNLKGEDTDIKTESGENKKITQGDKNSKLVLTRKQVEVVISSPLPPPDVLKKYAEIDPSFPERLLKLVENEQKFRHRVVYLGEIFGFVVVLGGFISAIVLGIYGKEWLAGTVGLGAISSIVGAYFYGKFKENQEKENQLK